MNEKRYTRLFDFTLILFSLSGFYFLWVLFLAAIVDYNAQDPIAKLTYLSLLAVQVWPKVGLAILFVKNVPFRGPTLNAPIEFKKIWMMSFCWPMLFVK